MKSLVYLWYLKLKAQVRYYFRKISTAILSIFLILVYGGIFLLSFLSCNNQPMEASPQLSTAILIVVGFLALMLFSTLLSPKKALFMGEDAYFLFSGPFSRKQVLSYLSFQTLTQALMIEFFVIYMFSATSIGLSYHWMFLLLLIISAYLIILSFLILTDYVYLLSIGDKKYKKIPYFIFAVFAIFILAVLSMTYMQTGDIQTLFINFIDSSMFYIIPLFGWLKLVLMSYVEGQYLYCLLGIALLLIGFIISYFLLVTYKGDFYEQALSDSLELSKLTKEARKGRTNLINTSKIKKEVNGVFKDGAYAILSKNVLLMKKTNQWITKNDLMVLGIYTVVTIITDIGFGFFIYMLVMYVFATLQQSDLYNELQNYHIYLIPDRPMKKLIAVILPTFIKVVITSAISLIIVGLYYHVSLLELINYCVILLGYISIFISSTVLSLRLLKSRSSQVFENLFRMLLMVICSIPSALLIAFVLAKGNTSPWVMFLLSYSSIIMNFVISFIVLYFCKDMMNGRELKSD